jgi:thiosulfate dehydrogenase
MGKFLGGLIIGLILFPLAVAVYFLGGFAPVAVSDHPFPLEPLIAGGALAARTRRKAPKRDLSSFATTDIVAGAQTYQRTCAGCHGLPDQTPSFPEPKMYPSPPLLFTPDGYVTDDPVGVTYWKIKNGIRLTGMPSFGSVLKDDQMWQIAALLASADKLPPEALDVLREPLFPPPPPPANATPGAGPSTSTSIPSASSPHSPPTGAPGAAPGSAMTPKNVQPMTGTQHHAGDAPQPPQ